MSTEARYKTALEAIVALDIPFDEHGKRNFHKGVHCFVKAWLIAHEALEADQEPGGGNGCKS